MKRLFFTLLVVCFSLCCNAQNSFKNENEKRIKKANFPKNALELLENSLPKRVEEVQYYKEQDSVKLSYETRLKYKGKEYSIEFSQNGVLEVAKVTIKAKSIKPRTLETIKKYLYTNYSSFRLKKIQRQYQHKKPNPEKIIKDAFSGDMKSSFSYEIIVAVKKGKKHYSIEITFTKDGDFESVRTII